MENTDPNPAPTPALEKRKTFRTWAGVLSIICLFAIVANIVLWFVEVSFNQPDPDPAINQMFITALIISVSFTVWFLIMSVWSLALLSKKERSNTAYWVQLSILSLFGGLPGLFFVIAMLAALL